MRIRAFLVLIAIAVVALVFTLKAGTLHAQSTNAVALTGVVSSAEEGTMEGVIVRAHAPGSTITTSVVTDESLESIINEWVSQGWQLDGIQFAMRESSKRPAMAFVLFTRDGAKDEASEPVKVN